MKKLALAAFVAYLIIATWWFISIARVSLAGTLPLFGNFRVLLVYCVASLPLCWCLASRCLGHVSGAKWIRVGVVGFISLVIGLILSRQPMQPDTTYLVRNVLRSICAVAMTMPAGMLFSAMQSKPNSLRRHSSFSQQLILSLLGAAILPALYVQNQVAAVRSTFMLQSGRGRIVQELVSAAQYMELHGDDQLGKRRLSVELKDLRRNYREVLAQVAKPLDESIRPEVHRRAMQMLSIDRQTVQIDCL